MATATYSNPDALNGNYNTQEGYAPDPGSTWVNSNGDLMGSSKGASGVSRFGNTSDNDTKKVADTNQTNSPNAVVNESFSPQQIDPVNSALYNAGVTPQQIAAYTRSLPTAQSNLATTRALQGDIAITDPDSTIDKILGGVALAGSVGALTAGAGTFIAPAVAGAVGTGVAGAATTGAAEGAVSGLASNLLTTGGKQGLGKAVGLGALGGGLGGALSYAIPGASSNIGESAAIKGATGAGMGALGSALSGGNVANGALAGGVSGAASGAIGSATGSQLAGTAAGTIGGYLTNKYLSSPSTTPTPAATTPAASTPARAITQNVGAQNTAQNSTQATGATTNIGPYAGFSSAGLGYQPMSQVNPGITNYNAYGQGPEASFFQPTPGT